MGRTFRKKWSVGFLLLTLAAGKASFSQSFTVSFPDTIVYGEAIDSTSLSCWTNDFVTNISGSTLVLDVVRVEDDTATPGWRSAFCFQICSQPFVDSIRATMAPAEVVNIAVHFQITGIPDSGTVLMKYKNVSNPAEVYYQRFYGISQAPSGFNAAEENEVSVKLFPNPLQKNQPLSFEINSPLRVNGSYSLNVLDALGNRVEEIKNINPAKQSLNLSLPSGIFFYQLMQQGIVIHTGKIISLD